MCPGSQGIPGSECKGCGAGRPVEGHRGSEGKGVGKGSPLPRSHAPSQAARAPRAHTRDTSFSQFGVPAWWVPGEGPLPGWHMATFSLGSAVVGRQFWFLPCLRAPIPS